MSTPKLESKLLKLYPTVSRYETILGGVRRGEQEFIATLKILNLYTRFSPHTSQVHTYDDIEVQAFVLGIPANGNPEEIRTKSFLTYASHFVDDFFDMPDLTPPIFEIMMLHRHNVKSLLDVMEDVGKLGHEMAKRTRNPEGLYKGLHRLVYGGLIKQAKDSTQQDAFLSEYKNLALKDVIPEVKESTESLRDIVLWLTNITAQDIWFAAEPTYNPTLAELWSMVYAPALHLHDANEERNIGEINFAKFGKQEPTIEEMVLLIDIAAHHLPNFQEGRLNQRLGQLRFLKRAFEQVLPREINEAYGKLESRLSKS